jgi:hypothetical protein
VSRAEDRRFRERYLERDKLVKAALGRVTKASKWRKNGDTLFQQLSDKFVAVRISHCDDSSGEIVVTAQVDVRPMAADELLWDILDVPKDERGKLSLRVTSAFACCGVPVSISEWPLAAFERDAANDLEMSLRKAVSALDAGPFSQLCAEHLGGASNLQAYPRSDTLWITFVCALIMEREFQTAKRILEVFERNHWGLVSSFYSTPERVDTFGGYPRMCTFTQMARNYIGERSSGVPKVPRRSNSGNAIH